MITYSLICDKDHEFSQMFDNYDDFAAQKKAKALECPSCGSKSIAKGLSAPSVSGESKPDMAPCGVMNGCQGGACGMG